MKIKHILFFAVAAALGSCTTAYRSAQTPDDVYYSPAPEQNEYVSNATEQDKNSYSYRNEETEIRRGIENPIYRNSITFSMGMGNYSPYSLFPYSPFSNPLYNPYGYNYYGYDPFTPYAYNPYGLKGGIYSPYNSFVYNDMTFYSPYSYGFSPYYGLSPYYGFLPYYNPYSSIFYSGRGDLRVNTNTGARRYNLNSYNNTVSRGNSTTRGTAQPIRRTETAAPVRNTGVGNVIRRVFTPTERRTYNTPGRNTTSRRYSNVNNSNNSINRYDNNNSRSFNNNRSNETRSYTPSVSTPSSSSRSSSSSSGSAPVRTFRR